MKKEANRKIKKTNIKKKKGNEKNDKRKRNILPSGRARFTNAYKEEKDLKCTRVL